MSQENVAAIRSVVEAFNRRDVQALTALLASDAEIVPIRAAVEEGTAYRGPDAAARWYAAVDEAWEDLRVEVGEVRDMGDRVVAFGRVWGRGRRSGAGIDIEAISVARFSDGLVSSLRIFSNRSDGLQAAELAE